MLNIPDTPPPAAVTAFRAPQARLNGHQIARDRAAAVTDFARTFWKLALVAFVTLAVATACMTAPARTTATVEQAEAWAAM